MAGLHDLDLPAFIFTISKWIDRSPYNRKCIYLILAYFFYFFSFSNFFVQPISFFIHLPYLALPPLYHSIYPISRVIYLTYIHIKPTSANLARHISILPRVLPRAEKIAITSPISPPSMAVQASKTRPGPSRPMYKHVHRKPFSYINVNPYSLLFSKPYILTP